ncbi:MAG: hypothetical protein ACR5KV_04010 [Wolbachia sp.]
MVNFCGESYISGFCVV